MLDILQSVIPTICLGVVLYLHDRRIDRLEERVKYLERVMTTLDISRMVSTLESIVETVDRKIPDSKKESKG